VGLTRRARLGTVAVSWQCALDSWTFGNNWQMALACNTFMTGPAHCHLSLSPTPAMLCYVMLVRVGGTGIARRTNNRKIVGSRPTKVVCIGVLTGNHLD